MLFYYHFFFSVTHKPYTYFTSLQSLNSAANYLVSTGFYVILYIIWSCMSGPRCLCLIFHFENIFPIFWVKQTIYSPHVLDFVVLQGACKGPWIVFWNPPSSFLVPLNSRTPLRKGSRWSFVQSGSHCSQPRRQNPQEKRRKRKIHKALRTYLARLLVLNFDWHTCNRRRSVNLTNVEYSWLLITPTY